MRPQNVKLLDAVVANMTGKAFDTFGHNLYTVLVAASGIGGVQSSSQESGPGEFGTPVTIKSPTAKATIVLQGSVDGTTWTQIGATQNITANGTAEITSTSVYYPYLRAVLSAYGEGTYTVTAAMSGHGGEGP